MDEPRKRRPIHLILDFDGTLTRKDTLSQLGRVGYRCLAKRASEKAKSEPQSWDSIVKAYIDDFESHKQSYQAPHPPFGTKPENAPLNVLHQRLAYLRSLRGVEEASAKRVSSMGIFDDVQPEDMEEGAARCMNENEVQFRNGWKDLIIQVADQNLAHFQAPSIQASPQRWSTERIDILSVNWSHLWVAELMKASWNKTAVGSPESNARSLLPTGPRCPANTVEARNKLRVEVYTNEIPHLKREIIGPDMTSTDGLRTGQDKLERLIARQRGLSDRMRHADPFTIYVGDSETDLDCLLWANYGICIRDEPMSTGQSQLAEVCEKANIKVRHVSEMKDEMSMEDIEDFVGCYYPVGSDLINLVRKVWESPPVLLWAKDFFEIRDWISRCYKHDKREDWEVVER